MKEYSAKEGELMLIFPGVSDKQKLRLECGSYPKVCGFAVLAMNFGEGENPSHYICTLGGKNNTPWCGASDLYPSEALEVTK